VTGIPVMHLTDPCIICTWYQYTLSQIWKT